MLVSYQIATNDQALKRLGNAIPSPMAYPGLAGTELSYKRS